MAGLPWLLGVQAELHEQWVEGMVDVDPTFRADFTFANGAREASMGRVGVPAFIGGVSGRCSFIGLDRNGPALLGMDHLRAMGFCIDFETGRCVVKALGLDLTLPRLPNGHLYIDILTVPVCAVQKSADAGIVAVR